MYTPWFIGTDETAHQVLRASESDYLNFLESTLQPEPAIPNKAWYVPALLFFADLLIAGGTKIKRNVMPHPRTSFQAR